MSFTYCMWVFLDVRDSTTHKYSKWLLVMYFTNKNWIRFVSLTIIAAVDTSCIRDQTIICSRIFHTNRGFTACYIRHQTMCVIGSICLKLMYTIRMPLIFMRYFRNCRSIIFITRHAYRTLICRFVAKWAKISIILLGLRTRELFFMRIMPVLC